jgi:hypothetical protein
MGRLSEAFVYANLEADKLTNHPKDTWSHIDISDPQYKNLRKEVIKSKRKSKSHERKMS